MEKAQPEESDWRPMIALTIIVAVVLIASSATVVNPRAGGPGNWKVGDFVEWTYSQPYPNAPTLKGLLVLRSVNETMVTVNITITSSLNIGPDMKPIPYYNELAIPKNYTATFFGIQVDYPQYLGYRVNWTGKETLYTKWGPRSCDRYQITLTIGEEVIKSYMWTWNGWTIKDASPGVVHLLTDTNLPQIIDP